MGGWQHPEHVNKTLETVLRPPDIIGTRSIVRPYQRGLSQRPLRQFSSNSDQEKKKKKNTSRVRQRGSNAAGLVLELSRHGHPAFVEERVRQQPILVRAVPGGKKNNKKKQQKKNQSGHRKRARGGSFPYFCSRRGGGASKVTTARGSSSSSLKSPASGGVISSSLSLFLRCRHGRLRKCTEVRFVYTRWLPLRISADVRSERFPFPVGVPVVIPRRALLSPVRRTPLPWRLILSYTSPQYRLYLPIRAGL